MKKNELINLFSLVTIDTLQPVHDTICSVEDKPVIRETKCPCCSLPITKQTGKKVVYTPFQKKQKNGNGGISLHPHCFNNGAIVPNKSKDSKASSNNTINHKVVVISPVVDSTYFTYYGLMKCSDVRRGFIALSNEYNNCQSSGVIIANAIEHNYPTFVQVDNDIYTITSVNDYDKLVKNVLGTRTK